MDIYSEIEKKVYNLREEIITNIKNILQSKGYGIGNSVLTPDMCVKFDIEFDRLIINNYHTDNISTDNLVKYLRSAIHVLSKNI